MNSRSGVSLVAAMVGMTLVSIAGVLLFSSLTQSTLMGARMEHRQRGEQVLSDFAARIQMLTFEKVRTLCLNPDRFGATQSQSLCPSPDRTQINSTSTLAPVPVGAGIPIPLDRPLDWNGDPVSLSPKVCVSVLSCKYRGNNEAIDLTLEGYWVDASTSQLTQRTLTFRKGR